MAKPIKETPILHGKDAERFMKAMEDEKNRPLSDEKKREIRESYEQMIKIQKF